MTVLVHRQSRPRRRHPRSNPWRGYPVNAGVVKVANGLWGASAASATVGLTLSNWVAILGSLASILLTLTAAVLLFIRIRKPRRFIEPIDPGPNAGVRVREAYYHALEQYNDAVRDDQP